MCLPNSGMVHRHQKECECSVCVRARVCMWLFVCVYVRACIFVCVCMPACLPVCKHRATLMNQEDMCSVLCMAGASPFVTDVLGDTALHKACLFGGCCCLILLPSFSLRGKRKTTCIRRIFFPPGHLSCGRTIMHHVVISIFAPSRTHPSLEDLPGVRCSRGVAPRVPETEGENSVDLSEMHPGAVFFLRSLLEPSEHQATMLTHRFPKGSLVLFLFPPFFCRGGFGDKGYNEAFINFASLFFAVVFLVGGKPREGGKHFRDLMLLFCPVS